MSEETEDRILAEDVSTSEPESSTGRVRELETELAELRDSLVRRHAEFDNYRKRVERERQDFAVHAASELIKELLPVMDNLERALGAPGDGAEGRLRQGVEITYRQLHEVFKRAGLREVPALEDRFDPHRHEAVDRVDTTEREEGTVVEVLQKGYFLKDRLLRPALVKVAKRPDGETEPDDPVSEAPAVED